MKNKDVEASATGCAIAFTIIATLLYASFWFGCLWLVWYAVSRLVR